MLASNGEAPKNGKVIGNIIATQSDQYKTELALRRMQSILYDRCESLARSEAGGAGLAGRGTLRCRRAAEESMLQFWMVLRNQTGKTSITLRCQLSCPLLPRRTGRSRLVGALGGMVGAASGEDGAGEVVKNGSRFAKVRQRL